MNNKYSNSDSSKAFKNIGICNNYIYPRYEATRRAIDHFYEYIDAFSRDEDGDLNWKR